MQKLVTACEAHARVFWSPDFRDSPMVVVCGGSYRRGKASCGDLDIVITHPDGKSSKSPDPGNEEYIVLDDNKYTSDLLAKVNAAKDQNYPVGRDDAVQLSTLQIFAEIGFVGSPESCTDRNTLLEGVLRQIAIA
ncbi:hypothetical protein Goari_018230 [Gossypium aridum]|uniref:DNA polymerase beta palm domain-containing protein n=1 Tax=Gossypium aridum TaxID=34290 RepID=A0A7J8WPD7_GOSAI|nr:hypothetical protein [Gossypium aridum]